MKKLSSYKTTEGAQWHREGAENGIRELKNHLTYPESRDDAKIEKTREGALWIIKPIVVKIIQIRISEPLKPAARPNLHIQTISKPYPYYPRDPVRHQPSSAAGKVRAKSLSARAQRPVRFFKFFGSVSAGDN